MSRGGHYIFGWKFIILIILTTLSCEGWGWGGAGGDIKDIGNLLTMWTRYTRGGLSLNILYIFHIYSEISKY